VDHVPIRPVQYCDKICHNRRQNPPPRGSVPGTTLSPAFCQRRNPQGARSVTTRTAHAGICAAQNLAPHVGATDLGGALVHHLHLPKGRTWHLNQPGLPKGASAFLPPTVTGPSYAQTPRTVSPRQSLESGLYMRRVAPDSPGNTTPPYPARLSLASL
jgi:hypothetical protein